MSGKVQEGCGCCGGHWIADFTGNTITAEVAQMAAIIAPASIGDASSPSGMIEAMVRLARLAKALAEVSDLFLERLKLPGEILAVDVDPLAAPAGDVRLSLKLTDRARGVAAAVWARDLDLRAVEEALGHIRHLLTCDPAADSESAVDGKGAAQ